MFKRVLKKNVNKTCIAVAHCKQKNAEKKNTHTHTHAKTIFDVSALFFSAGLSVAAPVFVPSLCAAATVVVSSLGVSPLGVALLFPFAIVSLGVASLFWVLPSAGGWLLHV